MGIFICWTPQSVLAAIGLTAYLILRGVDSMRSDDAEGSRTDSGATLE
jgi:hypothetical protein